MRTVRKCLKAGLQLAEGMSRAEFEKQFGPGKKENINNTHPIRSSPPGNIELGKEISRFGGMILDRRLRILTAGPAKKNPGSPPRKPGDSREQWLTPNGICCSCS